MKFGLGEPGLSKKAKSYLKMFKDFKGCSEHFLNKCSEHFLVGHFPKMYLCLTEPVLISFKNQILRRSVI